MRAALCLVEEIGPDQVRIEMGRTETHPTHTYGAVRDMRWTL